MSKTLAIIPARGGSQRIPHKNIKNFLNKPIISFPISTALNSKCFSTVMVSTDDKKIAKIAQKYGASVPFLRSIKNASNTATLTDVILEVINTYQKLNQNYDYICCILPTAVFTTINMLKNAFKLIKHKKATSLITVCQYGHPVQRALEFRNGKLLMKIPANEFMRTQDLSASFYDAAQFYWINTSDFLRKRKIFTDNTQALVLPEYMSHDIDTKNDWIYAEMKYQLLQKYKKK